MDIEGVSLAELRQYPPAEVDELLSFGQPITFRMGTATILAEFNRRKTFLQVNLGHVDEGGEGVLLRLWKLVRTYAKERDYTAIDWSIHALTCAAPNPRLQKFLRDQGFVEKSDDRHGRVLHKLEPLQN